MLSRTELQVVQIFRSKICPRFAVTPFLEKIHPHRISISMAQVSLISADEHQCGNCSNSWTIIRDKELYRAVGAMFLHEVHFGFQQKHCGIYADKSLGIEESTSGKNEI